MIKIVADSSADLLSMEGVAFASVPMHISTAERTFTDDASLDTYELLSYLEHYQGRSFTACPSTQAWLDAYEGGDEIYVVPLTSALSGAYNAAMQAASIYTEAHPGAKVHVFDTLTTGPQLRMIAEKAAELALKRMPFELVVAAVEDYIRSTGFFFVFQSLHNFAQNGRVSKVVAAAVGVLNIRIVGSAKDGCIEPLAKCRGDRKSMDEVLKRLKDAGCNGKRFRIMHIDNAVLAQKYRQELLAVWPDAEIVSYPARGLCSYYGERGGLIVGFETDGPAEAPETPEENA